jgi:hypothetical protein
MDVMATKLNSTDSGQGLHLGKPRGDQKGNQNEETQGKSKCGTAGQRKGDVSISNNKFRSYQLFLLFFIINKSSNKCS